MPGADFNQRMASSFDKSGRLLSYRSPFTFLTGAVRKGLLKRASVGLRDRLVAKKVTSVATAYVIAKTISVIEVTSLIGLSRGL
jgi:hypothetical protein